MSELRGTDLIARFEQFAPRWLAEEGDPIGLALGTLNKTIKKVMVTLDVRPEIVAEAIEAEVDLIFSHHPPIFRPVPAILTDNPQTKMYADLLTHNIAVYSAHTNLDAATGGINDWLAEALNLEDTEIMSVTKEDGQQQFGFGRVGKLNKAVPFDEYLEEVAEIFNVKGLRYITDNSNKLVDKVAVLGGDGGKYYPDALKKGADVYITGDVYYHVGHDMQADGLSVIDPGHHIESICKSRLKILFEDFAKEADWTLEVIESDINTDPFQFYPAK